MYSLFIAYSISNNSISFIQYNIKAFNFFAFIINILNFTFTHMVYMSRYLLYIPNGDIIQLKIFFKNFKNIHKYITNIDERYQSIKLFDTLEKLY